MSIIELEIKLDEQMSLLQQQISDHSKKLLDYPTGKFNLTSVTKLESVFNNILTCNEILSDS